MKYPVSDFLKSAFQRVVWLGSYILLFLFTDFSIMGREHLKDLPRPLLVVGTHKSFWDVPMVGLLFPFFAERYYPLGYMTSDAFFRNPFVRLIMWLGGGVRARKGEGLGVSLSEPRAILAKKKVFVIFPFGKRVWDGNYPRPGRGVATLLQEIPDLFILPVYMDTTPNVSLLRFLFGRKRMAMFVGKPFAVPDAAHRATDEVTRILIERVFALSPRSERAPHIPD